jgi:hypothetical protein
VGPGFQPAAGLLPGSGYAERHLPNLCIQEIFILRTSPGVYLRFSFFLESDFTDYNLMRSSAVYFLMVVLLGLGGCAPKIQNQAPPARLTAGFWFWRGTDANAASSKQTLDVLFVHVGSINRERTPPFVHSPEAEHDGWAAYGYLPEAIPPAKEYWLVFRYEHQGVPDLAAVPVIAETLSSLQEIAIHRHMNIAGIQLDIDSPTAALPQYAGFLREMRKELPTDVQISITALLDWFRDGTSIAAVIKQTDEFVPQFYDVGDFQDYRGEQAIAAKIDPARWKPVFNRFGKRFRIGISTFGRARLARRGDPTEPRNHHDYFFPDLKPMEIATNPAFQLQTARSDAGELLLNYQATQNTLIGYNNLKPGDALQFTLPTPEVIQAAMESVKRIAGHLAGVVFFRWPSSNEALAMQPDDVLVAAGFLNRDRPSGSSVIANDGGCAAVSCVDLFLSNAPSLSSQPVRYLIHSSTAMEYFLPESKMPVQMAGPEELDVTLPPYCTRGVMYLGRAVSMKPAQFVLEEAK